MNKRDIEKALALIEKRKISNLMGIDIEFEEEALYELAVRAYEEKPGQGDW
jgi:ATP-dependent protease Clp ATPase subunit